MAAAVIKENEMKILDVKWKPMDKLYSGLISGHLNYSGTLHVLVDKRVNVENRVYKKYGKYLYSEDDGFVSVYLHNPGSTRGFAGAKNTLNVEGEQKTFVGSLWDPTGYDDTTGLPEYRSVSLTDDPQVMEKGFTFFHAYVTKSLYEELCEKIGVKNPVLGTSKF